jgi:hypothetical protein
MAIVLVAGPIYYFFGEGALVYAIPPTCLATTFLFGLWVGRRVESRFLLHGLLVGLVAVVLNLATAGQQALSLAYVIAGVLKLIGGPAGAGVAERRANRRTAQGVSAV